MLRRTVLVLFLLVCLSARAARGGLGSVGGVPEDCASVEYVSELHGTVSRPNLQTLSIDEELVIQLREGAESSDGLLLPSCAIGISASNSERVLPHGLEGFEWVGSMSRTTALRAEVFNITDSIEKDLCSAPIC